MRSRELAGVAEMAEERRSLDDVVAGVISHPSFREMIQSESSTNPSTQRSTHQSPLDEFRSLFWATRQPSGTPSASAFQINKGWHYTVQFERCFLLCLYECLHICIHIYVEMSMVKTTIKFVDMIFGSQPSIL